MKVALIYFSGTGLTSELAFRISLEFEKRGHSAERIRFKGGKELPPLSGYDLIGFGAPTYSFNAPRIFLRFLKSLNGGSKLRCFLFLTAHGAPGITAPAMDRILKKRGFLRVGEPVEGYGVNNIRAWRRKIGAAEQRETFYTRGDISGKVENIIGSAEKGSVPGPVLPKRPGLAVFCVFFTARWQMALVEGLRKRIDRDKCTKCRICFETICPSGAIIESGGGFPRIIQRSCVGCSGCVNLCPADAIYTGINKNRQPCDLMKRHILKGY